MGLTILSYLVGPFFIVAWWIAHRNGRGTSAGRIVEAIDLLLAVYAVLQGVIVALASTSYSQFPATATRVSAVFLLGASLLVLIFALEFPVKTPRALRIVVYPILAAVFGLGSYWIMSSIDFVVNVIYAGGDILRYAGIYYLVYSNAQAGIGLLASAIFAIRTFTAKTRINQQRAGIGLAGVLPGTLAVWILFSGFSQMSVVANSFVLTPIAVLALGAGCTYALYISRLFDWRSIFGNLVNIIILFIAVGAPVGLALVGLGWLGAIQPLARYAGLLVYLGTPVTFFLGYLWARWLYDRVSRRSRRLEYRGELESALAHVDLSAGRDVVLGELHSLVTKALDFSDFTVVIEDDRGVLRSVYSPTGLRATVDRDTPVAKALEASPVTALLKSEAIANPAFDGVRKDLLDFFESLHAEALIIIREGRHVTGLFAFGARSTGASYTAYDYETFKALYGKLFVFAYYLKNVARESILHTVDRELALSDQIIRFALEKVDRMDHPKADVSWTMQSARRLGGDFIDFVRLSQDRWFFVMGDISGKGLSASMNMLILKSMVRTFLRIEKDFVSLVSRVNAFIKENLPRGTFFAGIFGYFDLSKDAFYYINCGMPAVLLYSPSFDTFIEVQGEGKILGFVKDISPFLKPRKLVLQPGSAIVACTDGITDSENLRGERFGKERLVRAVRERLEKDSKEINEGVIGDFLLFTDQKQEDDVTLLVMKFKGRSEE